MRALPDTANHRLVAPPTSANTASQTVTVDHDDYVFGRPVIVRMHLVNSDAWCSLQFPVFPSSPLPSPPQIPNR
jgi:hypothetical protein